MEPRLHFEKTYELASSLDKKDIYYWLITKGYFPEAYVLPPCFYVEKYPEFNKQYNPYKNNEYKPKLCEVQDVHYPKTDLTDRTFSIIDPEIHSDISFIIANNWEHIINHLFDEDNKVYSYSFPIPLDSNYPSSIGKLRSGRMIYEYLEMAEKDLASIAYRYNYLIKTDIKSFYPSIYTHSIAWALHGKDYIRKKENRFNYTHFGNRLDKLFQNSNDGCTNGIPIGPAVSDLIAEVILSGVDRKLSNSIDETDIVVRFKDDYMVLTKSAEKGRTIIKELQVALKEFRLELNDDKTEVYNLPDGLFRKWKIQYLLVNPPRKIYYSLNQFISIYHSVVKIDREFQCGVVDSFLAGLVTNNNIKVKLKSKSMPIFISLLLKLGSLRIKAFPKVLAILELIIKAPSGINHKDVIGEYLAEYLDQLYEKEAENRYLLTWICYFLRVNELEHKLKKKYTFDDTVVRAVYSNRFTKFNKYADFKIFQGVGVASKRISMHEHLDVFKPQQ